MHHGPELPYGLWQIESGTWNPDLSVQRAALNRYRAAIRSLDQSRIAFESSPNDLTADGVRSAEIELEDAIAIAGEFHVVEVPWSLP
jgi:hypothetical protein